MCRHNRGSTDPAGSHLDGDDLQSIKQDNSHQRRALLGAALVLLYPHDPVSCWMYTAVACPSPFQTLYTLFLFSSLHPDAPVDSGEMAAIKLDVNQVADYISAR